MKLDSLTKETEELETKDAAQISSTNAKKFIDTKEFQTQNFQTPQLQEMKDRMFSAVAEVNNWKRIIISYHDAQLQAKLEYMTKSEREIWQQYFNLLAQKKNLEELLKTLKKPAIENREARKVYDDLVFGIKSKIFALFSASTLLKKTVEEIEKRLDSPDFKNNILLVTHKILQQNIFAKQMLKRASENLNRAVEQLQNEIVNQSATDQNIFKTREVYDIIRRQFFALKKTYEKTLEAKITLQKRLQSPTRALSMAKSIFSQGKLKTLRIALRRFKRDSLIFHKKLEEYKKREQIFITYDWNTDNRSEFLQQKYSLAKQKTFLEIEKARLDKLQLALDKEKAQLEETDNTLKLLAEKNKHTKEQLEILQTRLALDKTTTCYKVTSSNHSQNTIAALIADAILNDPQAVQLVARSSGNNLEMEKNWELMSDIERDDLISKKIVRNL